jgi:hypothetical protein
MRNKYSFKIVKLLKEYNFCLNTKEKSHLVFQDNFLFEYNYFYSKTTKEILNRMQIRSEKCLTYEIPNKVDFL